MTDSPGRRFGILSVALLFCGAVCILAGVLLLAGVAWALIAAGALFLGAELLVPRE